MKTAVDQLREEEISIEDDIYELCQGMISDKAEPIYDGPVNFEKYVNGEKYKICWVLKESYDKKGNGNWNLGDFIGDETRWHEITKHPTWRNVKKATYGIINNFIGFSEIEKINDGHEMVKCLNYITVINVNKMPAGSESADAVIAKKYEHFKSLLHRQFKTYDPQIIIFGSTFQHFQNDLEIKDEELTNYYKDKKKPRYIVKNGKLYMDTYHPAVRASTMTDDDYVQSIIDIVKMNKDKIK
jgi:hypothetical protein